MQKYTYICWIHTDAMITDAWQTTHAVTIKMQEGRRKKTFLEKYIYLSLYCKGSKGLFKGLHVRGCWRPNINFIFWPHCYDRHVVSFLFSWCWSPLHRGFSEGPLGRVWLSLPHLVSSCLEVCWQLLWHPTQLNYIIIQRPHNRPLDLWNRMFNRHQAEITVMQFRGYSLPVHHCSGTMGPSPCPISKALIRPRDLFRLLAIGMCHFLPVYHLGIIFLGRVEGQNITLSNSKYSSIPV